MIDDRVIYDGDAEALSVEPPLTRWPPPARAAAAPERVGVAWPPHWDALCIRSHTVPSGFDQP